MEQSRIEEMYARGYALFLGHAERPLIWEWREHCDKQGIATLYYFQFRTNALGYMHIGFPRHTILSDVQKKIVCDIILACGIDTRLPATLLRMIHKSSDLVFHCDKANALIFFQEMQRYLLEWDIPYRPTDALTLGELQYLMTLVDQSDPVYSKLQKHVIMLEEKVYEPKSS